MGWGTPPPDMGWDTPPDLGWGTPQTWDWVYPPRQISIASTSYAAGGVPLAFTQEDFLVFINYYMGTIVRKRKFADRR